MKLKPIYPSVKTVYHQDLQMKVEKSKSTNSINMENNIKLYLANNLKRKYAGFLKSWISITNILRMNITRKFLILTVIILFSNCSKDKIILENEDDSKLEEVTLISKIESLNKQPWEKLGDQFFYENSRLKFALFEGTGWLNYFEYDNMNNVSRIYRYYDYNRDEFIPTDINIEEIKSEGNIFYFIYENDKLIERRAFNGFVFYYNYDEKERLKSWELYNVESNDYSQQSIINYDDQDNILNIQLYSLSNGNNLIAEYAYEFDDKINPLYPLFINNSISDIETSRSLDYSMIYGLVFKNNVTKIYKNGELYYTANLEYNGEYPIKNSWILYDCQNNYCSNVDIFSY